MKKSMYSFVILTLLFSVFSRAVAAKTYVNEKQDSLLRKEIKKQLSQKSHNPTLYYPLSVGRYYTKNNFQPAWIIPQNGEGPAWQAMLMIDCVLQFGLSHDDYHPKELSYDMLHNILERPGKIALAEQARFDIILSDAVITLMNHLHYGKFNPEYTAVRIDKGNIIGFNTEDKLAIALKNIKNHAFMNAIAGVQPKSKEYVELQYRMRILKGEVQADCYDVPEATIRKIAINMERLRWTGTATGNYIEVNVPSYILKFHLGDSTYQFKIIAGKPTRPTPLLQSTIHYFTTAPDRKLSKKIFVNEILPNALSDSTYLENNHLAIYDNSGNYIKPGMTALAMIKQHPDAYYARRSAGCDNTMGRVVFYFPNRYGIYLHDTPEKQLFKNENRDFSSGCIRVENAAKLAQLLLLNDGQGSRSDELSKAIAGYQTKKFILKTPLPIKILYLTCEMKNGVLVTYDDIYGLDDSLEMALYNMTQSLVMRN